MLCFFFICLGLFSFSKELRKSTCSSRHKNKQKASFNKCGSVGYSVCVGVCVNEGVLCTCTAKLNIKKNTIALASNGENKVLFEVS